MLLRIEEKDNIQVGIWKIEESINKLSSELDKLDVDYVMQGAINQRIIKEKLAVRLLLKRMYFRKVFLKHNDLGKPILDDDNMNISVSHTLNYVAIALSKEEMIGIDIEKVSDKVLRIESKFINHDEFIDPLNKRNHLLIHWSAKESIYKAMSTNYIHLKDDITIKKFNPSFSGDIIGVCENYSFDVEYKMLDEYVLTLARVRE